MIDANKLWKERFQYYLKDTRRYLRLIFNDHLKFVLLFAVGGGAYYYQNWLKTLPEDFPAAFIIAFIIAIFLTKSPIRTFLKEADLVFLLPVETKLKPYFIKSIIYSYMLQFYILLVILAVLGPLYLSQQDASINHFIFIAILVFVIKAVNLIARWFVQISADERLLKFDQAARFIINFAFVYVALIGDSFLITAGCVLLFIMYVFYAYSMKKGKGVKWELLVELEAKRMMTFYRIANMFTDVPKLKEQVKPRNWLNWMANRLPFSQSSAFSLLYLRTFQRSSDYLGVYVRLIVIGGLLLYFLPISFGKMFVVLFFLYLSGFQLLPLYRHHAMKIWIHLYPISSEQRRVNFLQLIFRLQVFKSVVLALVVLITGDFLLSCIVLGAGIIFSYLFTFRYVNKKLISQEGSF
ncbi:ABC transporter permease [Calidifontibacillus erzurumensis]|uniref:ABC transporter permease n=1 Tax=Calidifontibacillus erzurumensis TaxID=2741433 RepID=A0A8J8GHS5_9BACI|nr:ABC transporter permease [Calidifontibacillus erzurumensis]NSL52006.1 ABC transporter permease [Calidifontibacillus erzurumensis]